MSKRLLAFVVANIREFVFAAGLSLVTTGLALVWMPAAFIVPGSVLVWIAIPPPRPRE